MLRLQELEREAINRATRNIDISDFLSDDEWEEYRALHLELEGECLSCGESADDCDC